MANTENLPLPVDIYVSITILGVVLKSIEGHLLNFTIEGKQNFVLHGFSCKSTRYKVFFEYLYIYIFYNLDHIKGKGDL